MPPFTPPIHTHTHTHTHLGNHLALPYVLLNTTVTVCVCVYFNNDCLLIPGLDPKKDLWAGQRGSKVRVWVWNRPADHLFPSADKTKEVGGLSL